VQTQTEGLIIKSRDINENDTVVKILTGDLGLISAFANEESEEPNRERRRFADDILPPDPLPRARELHS